MDSRTGIAARGGSRWWLVFLLLGLAAPAAAQKAVVVPCSGKVRPAAAKKIRRQVLKALKDKGVDLVAPAAYIRAARKAKVARRAYDPKSVAKVAPEMGLDGIVTCDIRRNKGRYSFVFKVLGADGSTRDEVNLRNRKPVLGRPGIEKVAVAAQAGLGGAPPLSDEALAAADDIALIPLVPLVPVDEKNEPDEGKAPAAEGPATKPPADQVSDTSGPASKEPVAAAGTSPAPEAGNPPVGTKDDGTGKPALPPIALAFQKPGGETPAPAADAPPAAEVTRAAPEPPPSGEPKSVPEVWVAAGASMHLRAGLNPRYQAGPFPGFRIEGRAFLGSFIDMTGLSDLGLDFAYDRGIGLTYSSAFRPDQIDAYEQHWRVGLVYRLSFEQVTAGPAVLFRVGYGNTTNGVDKAYPDLVSAGYSHLDVSVDAHAWLVRPLLKAYLSVGWVAMVQPAESLSGSSGMGVTFGGGVALELFEAVHLSAGYEQWQFVFDEDSMGETSDRYQMLFFRAGWTYR